MGLLDALRGQLIDVIEWIDDEPEMMVYRFDRRNNEIKTGARLTVRPSQMAVFINNGTLTDVFKPGMYELNTSSLPILSNLLAWKHGFNNPFSAEVYFVSTRQFNLKWGTNGDIMVNDPETGATIPIRAFGVCAVCITNPVPFLNLVSGTDGRSDGTALLEKVKDIVVPLVIDALGGLNLPVSKMAGQNSETNKIVTDLLKGDLERFGLELARFAIQNISLPPEVEADMKAAAGNSFFKDPNRFSQIQAAKSIGTAAGNQGGMAGDMMGMMVSMGMANQMAQVFAANAPGNAAQAQAAAKPPPIPGQILFHVAVGGQQQGPFPLDILNQMVGSGQLQRETLVWKEGMAQWAKASDVAELSTLFKAVPPPLPQ